MWFLVIFTMLANTSSGGGTHTTVNIFPMSSQQQCKAAAATLAEQGDFNGPPTNYRIFGKCIQK
jgi:hypothetical protein